jgi:starch synthase
MNVAFVNENTLGHPSYLLPYTQELRAHPELGITPYIIDATPLPPDLARFANFSIRGLRKWGLDFHNARWRMTVSRFVRQELERLRSTQQVDAVLANTQSTALALTDLAHELPVFVCLDATFEQLALSRWFAPNWGTRVLLPLTAGFIRGREREVLHSAYRLFPWSDKACQSLLDDYGLPPEKISVLPPSVHLPASRVHTSNARRQILFMGGDFRRKGGRLLLDCYRRWFSSSCDLHLVTHSPIDEEPGVYVHRNIEPYSETWLARWHQADVFVFPSTLETFGIVLLEALAFEVPVISADVGAARYVLADGEAGWLLADQTPEALAKAIQEVLDDPPAARRRALKGRRRAEECFDLSRNTKRLATWLHEACAVHQSGSQRVKDADSPPCLIRESLV